jgi:hypothetical protein
MKYRKYLNEERLHSKDKRAIIGFMKSPPKSKTAHKMQSGELFKVEPTNNGVKFIYDKDDFEFVTTLVDIADSLGGYKFQSKPGVFTVMVK